MKIAFYAPLKPPDHAVPSGDRTMARALLAALNAGGNEVRLASRLRSFAREPSAAVLVELKQSVDGERRRILAEFSVGDGWRPEVWLTYHPYYKSPDLIGPAVARSLGIAYATVEASFSARRGQDAWAAWHNANLDALTRADVHFVMTPRDRVGLEACPGRTGMLVDLPPFIEGHARLDEAVGMSSFGVEADGPVRLIVVAMMRADVKRRSYRMLATSLGRLRDLDWTLDIVGDGEGRTDVEAAFAETMGDAAAERIAWHGLCDEADVRRLLADAELFVWPGFDEGYGLAFLEAQAAGLPVVAQHSGGVPAVVKPGQTGLLTPEGDVEAYCDALRSMIVNRRLRRVMGHAARLFVQTERTTAHAAEILSKALMRVVA